MRTVFDAEWPCCCLPIYCGRAFPVLNALNTIDNETFQLIIYCFNAFVADICSIWLHKKTIHSRDVYIENFSVHSKLKY